MDKFNRQNMRNIKQIFSEKTGVEARPCRNRSSVHFIAAAVLLIVCCLGTTAVAVSLFSTLSGDSIIFTADYEGDGIISLSAENRSDKDLKLEPDLKILLGKAGTEVERIGGEVVFDSTVIPANSNTVLKLDISGAYDVSKLVIPPSGDFYSILLTNDGFAVGQKWTCAVIFRENPLPESVSHEYEPPKPEPQATDGILEPLRQYFDTSTLDPFERWAKGHEYLELVEYIIADKDVNVIAPVSPHLLIGRQEDGVIFDDTVSADRQHELTGLHYHVMDGYYKVVGAAEDDKALVLSAYVPQYEGGTLDDGLVDIPILYVFIYEADSITGPRDHAFIRGQLLTFEQMERYKVYEDGQYVCYEVTDLFFTDLQSHAESILEQRNDGYLDDNAMQRVENIYNYYRDRENLNRSFFYPEVG